MAAVAAAISLVLAAALAAMAKVADIGGLAAATGGILRQPANAAVT